MATHIAFHEVDDVDHWLSSSKRDEVFAPLGITMRAFRDPAGSNRVGLIAEIPDMAAFQKFMATEPAADAMKADGGSPGDAPNPQRGVTLSCCATARLPALGVKPGQAALVSTNRRRPTESRCIETHTTGGAVGPGRDLPCDRRGCSGHTGHFPPLRGRAGGSPGSSRRQAPPVALWRIGGLVHRGPQTPLLFWRGDFVDNTGRAALMVPD
jgi:hypothetical protein